MSNNDVTTEAAAVAVGIGAPVILWGAPGTGKTSVIRGLADAWGLECEVVVASIHDPTDFSGLPVVGDEGVSLAPPAWARRLSERGSGRPLPGRAHHRAAGRPGRPAAGGPRADCG